jgi:unsaturated chondroitin disaccharide hydrolase
MAMLKALCNGYLAPADGGQRGNLMHGCYSKPHNESVDSAVLFGERYFAEALCKVAYPGRIHTTFPKLARVRGC